MRQNKFGSRAPPGPTEGTYALPQAPSHIGGLGLRGGREGKGRGPLPLPL